MPLVVRMLPARVVNRSPMLSFAPSTSALRPNATTAAASLLGAPPRARSLGTPFAGVLSGVEAAHPAAKSGASDRSESTGNPSLLHAQNSGHTAGSRPSGSVGTTNPAAAAPVAPPAPPPTHGTERRESPRPLEGIQEIPPLPLSCNRSTPINRAGRHEWIGIWHRARRGRPRGPRSFGEPRRQTTSKSGCDDRAGIGHGGREWHGTSVTGRAPSGLESNPGLKCCPRARGWHRGVTEPESATGVV